MANDNTWFHRPTILTILLTLLVTLASGAMQRSCEKSDRDYALKLAFSGEVSALRGAIEYATINAFNKWQNKERLEPHRVEYPKVVFEVNAANLGNIQDRELIKQLSNLYSFMARINETNDFSAYLQQLAYCWHIAINLDMRLQEQTRNTQELDWKVKLSQKDAADHQLADRILQELNLPTPGK